MTLKRHLFISNLLIIAVPVIAWIVVTSVFRVVLLYGTGVDFPQPDEEKKIVEEHFVLVTTVWLSVIILMAAIIFINNRFVMGKIVRRIKQDHEQYENDRRTLLAGISHDLRTPLGAIKAYLEGIETGVAITPEKRAAYFSVVKSKTNELEHIINQLFLFSKLDMDEYPLNLQVINIGAALSEMVEELEDEYESKGLAISIRENNEKIEVKADGEWLRNVIVNILENSAKYKTAETGHLQVEWFAKDGFVEIKLTDDGPGVSPEALPKLFDVFYRADPARSSKIKGSGLGLAIASKILERMGGKIYGEISKQGGLAIVIHLPTHH
ncbi:hypothetical protein AGMMS49938_01790 [Fibrobacterales bacterium]|nr:hypothetical protein AGMMS49938_01790 [Fibrobacterales bacterium]